MNTVITALQWVLGAVVALFVAPIFAVASYRVYKGTDKATCNGLNVKVKVGEKVVAVKQSIKGKTEVIG